jgi:hypothetical protein
LIASICLVLLLAYVAIASMATFSTSIAPSQWHTLLALFVVIHICAWYFSRRVRRHLRTADLVHLSIGCAIAFCLVDEGLTIAFRWAGLIGAPESYVIAKTLLAIVVDALIVVAIVFITVPLGVRFLYGRGYVA